MSIRSNCDELLETTLIIENGLLTPLNKILEHNLNHVFATNKMTIGQIAVHCGAWAEYFMADKNPWKPVEWTCKPVSYPLTLDTVTNIVTSGFHSIKRKLNQINDTLLEVDSNGKKGKGYIVYRLLLHTMVHANQMAYLRQIVEPEWKDSGMFGKMANAIIRLKYHTTKDQQIRGF